MNLNPLMLLFSLGLGLALAGGGQPNVQQAGPQIDAAVQAGQMLRALKLAENFERATRKSGAHDYAGQTLSQVQAFVGQTQEAIRTADELHPDYDPAPPLDVQALARLNGSTVQDAVPAIVEAARGHRIVILNEAHHVPQGRVFAQQLALALRKEGFTSFAAETFAPGVAASVKSGFPTLKTGY